jgi:hypothetical protein
MNAISLLVKLLYLAFAALHLPFAPFKPIQLTVEIFFLALDALFLLRDCCTRLAHLRFGLVTKLKRLIFGMQNDILLLRAGGFKQQSCLRFVLAQTICQRAFVKKNADTSADAYSKHQP